MSVSYKETVADPLYRTIDVAPSFYRATDAEPTKDEIWAVFAASKPSDWLYDDESDIFTLRHDLLVFLVGSGSGSYMLKYGHMDIGHVSSEQIPSIVREERLQYGS